MHGLEEFKSDIPADSETSGPWWKLLNRYHWFVFVVAALGWLFDTMDQQLFTLGRPLAMVELIKQLPDETKEQVTLRRGEFGGYATSIFLIGWATGGLIFGVLGDRWGRVKTMLATIIVYSIFTGLSSFSRGFWDFALWRFLTGLGVGGEFAVGVSLVAEVMPSRARPHALGLLQALSAVGNITAAVIGMMGTDWRTMFLIGSAPALLSLIVRRRLKEPERWQSVSTTEGVAKQLGSYSELFGNRELRYRAFIGLLLASSGVIGLWGIGFFTADLQREVFGPVIEKEGLHGQPQEFLFKLFTGKEAAGADKASVLKFLSGTVLLLQNVGAFFGIFMFSHVSHYLGRRSTFGICFFAAMLTTANVFWNLGKFDGVNDIFWMVPLMGFFQLSVFGGYAIYFPELFPTRLRSTGTSFCYNVGRFVAAIGPFTLGKLIRRPLSDGRRNDVLDLFAGPNRAAVRSGDEGQAAAGIIASKFP
jgi:MFS family permease